MIRQALTVPGPISSGGEERGVYAAWAVISSDISIQNGTALW